jgi:hypothetical protein
MNNSQQHENSPPKISGKSERQPSREKKQSKSKSNTFGNSKGNVLKEMLQKQENNKLPKDNSKTGLLEDAKGQGISFKNRKMSVEDSRTDQNTLKVIKTNTRSRKANSNKPTHGVSRADSRETSTRSNKEDIKSGVADDQPANNQVPPESEKEGPVVNDDVNIVTKFAFATRVGYIPNNPYKVNQDAYILSPNL